MQVHQLHPSVSYGDAIGNEILEIKKILSGLGYRSEIFAQFRDPRVGGVHDYGEYKKFSSPDNILILHYSIGYGEELLNFVRSLPDKKVLLYHNITPSHFFHGINSDYEYFSMLGRQELAGISRLCRLSLGDSEYNRQELDKLGFKNTGVLPYINDFSKYGIKENEDTIKKFNDGRVNILFVGRISPNKKIEDIIKSFYYYHKYVNVNSRLFLVGSYAGMDAYYSRLRSMVNALSLAGDVHFTGHVTFEEMLAYYKIADVFLCMSEHEGFCVPLLEAMYLKIPIIAYGSSAIPYTMGGSGILFDEKNYCEIAESIDLLVEDKALRDKVIVRQADRLEAFKPEKAGLMLEQYVEQVKADKASPLEVQLEGTFEDSYSLSIINRNLALALDKKGCDVSLYATTGTGDYTPKEKDLGKGRVRSLYLNKKNTPEFSIRNIYPPIIRDIKGKHKLIYFYWEESRIPDEWVKDFNTLDAVIVASHFVKKVLVDNGVTARVEVIPNGINTDLFGHNSRPMKLDTKKKFKYLSISSGFPRKGIDVLIKAYCEEFSGEDSVCLVIKTFPNIHNNISEIIKKHAKHNGAEIIHIDRDMHDEELASLYKACDCLVSPTRGEGFGLPMAEAMLSRIPVITTNYSGQIDFCTDDTSYLIDYGLVPSGSHVKSAYHLADSKWAEPDVLHLRKLMRHVYENKDSDEVKKKVDRAYDNIKGYTWESTAEKTIGLLEDIKSKKAGMSVRVGIVSTWNVKCGIAEYTKYLTDNLSSNVDKVILANYVDPRDRIVPDGPMAIRCWDCYSSNLDGLYDTIMANNLEVVHVQFNYGFFELGPLMALIKKLKAAGVRTIITFHSTNDAVLNGKKIELSSIKDELKQADALWVHSGRDAARLSSMGVTANVVLLPHGNKVAEDVDREAARDGIFTRRKIIALFGFFLPHKGILEAVRSIEQLKKTYPDILFLVCSAIYPNPVSDEYYAKCKKEVDKQGLKGNVLFFTDYLSDDEIMALLHCADMILMPYKDTGESASGAIRLALASCRPVIVTDIPIFSEFNGEVYKIKKCLPEDIANGVIGLYQNPRLCEEITRSAKDTLEQNSWKNIAIKYESLLKGLMHK